MLNNKSFAPIIWPFVCTLISSLAAIYTAELKVAINKSIVYVLIAAAAASFYWLISNLERRKFSKLVIHTQNKMEEDGKQIRQWAHGQILLNRQEISKLGENFGSLKNEINSKLASQNEELKSLESMDEMIKLVNDKYYSVILAILNGLGDDHDKIIAYALYGRCNIDDLQIMGIKQSILDQMREWALKDEIYNRM